MNLQQARNPRTERSREESVLIWRLTLKWWLGGREGRRNPKTQREWARQLGVSQPYVVKIVRRLKRDWLDMADRWRDEPEATLEDLRLAAESRKIASQPQWPVGPHPARPDQIPQQSPAWVPRVADDLSRVDDALLWYATGGRKGAR
jgi:hypothetical protein